MKLIKVLNYLEKIGLNLKHYSYPEGQKKILMQI